MRLLLQHMNKEGIGKEIKKETQPEQPLTLSLLDRNSRTVHPHAIQAVLQLM